VETNGGARVVDIDIDVLDEAEPLRGLLMIVFRDLATTAEAQKRGLVGPAASRGTARLAGLERELEHARSELQTIREEMRTSQEELTSANEELQSTNEELQSTNEELTTSKEEMQSLNEELQTVNTELQAKVEDMSLTNSDMKNLLNSTDIAIVFLDPELQVRRFTSHAAKIIKLIPGDVGRPITDLASDLRYPNLAEDARQVLRTLVFCEKAVRTRDGRWFTVRIMPYHTLDERIDGLVLTFADISAAKSLEAKLRAKQAGLEKRIGDQVAQLARRSVRGES
jgi:two-component system, chemotaxis family, CheB/CheR fusion protein